MSVYLGTEKISVYTGGIVSKPEEEKTVTAGTTPIEVIPSEGKLISKITVNPTPTEEKIVTPTTEDLIVAPVEGKQLNRVTVQGDANFLEENIAEGVTMWGKTGTHQGGGVPGQYVWSKQYAASTVTEDTTGGTYVLTTPDNTKPSIEIEIFALEPTYNTETKQWVVSTELAYEKHIITNSDDFIPNFSGGYARIISQPNVWYHGVNFTKSTSSPYQKSITYSKKYTAAIDSSYIEYVTGETSDEYPDGGWKDGAWYKMFQAEYISENISDFTVISNLAGKWINDIHFENGLYVLGGSNGADMYYSYDGITWTKCDSVGTTQKICYGNDIWVAAGYLGTGSIRGMIYSYDGITWSSTTQLSTDDYSDVVAFGNGVFVMEIGDCMYYSYNGINWSRSNVTSNVSLQDVWFINNVFFASAVNKSTNAGILYRSIDGITWTNITPSNAGGSWFYGLSYGDGKYVLTCGSKLYYSEDGLTFTLTFSPPDSGSLKRSDYNNGRWVAVGYKLIGLSDDGVNWTTISCDNQLQDVLYKNGIWLAVSYDGYLYKSIDGINFEKDPVSIGVSGADRIEFYNGIFFIYGSGGMAISNIEKTNKIILKNY